LELFLKQICFNFQDSLIQEGLFFYKYTSITFIEIKNDNLLIYWSAYNYNQVYLKLLNLNNSIKRNEKSDN